MSTATATPAPPRTEADIVREMSALAARMTQLQLELKRVRNPTGKTLADFRGIWADQPTTDEQLDAAELRFRDELADPA